MCGGQSSRMQQDKGLMLKEDQHWAQLAAEKLRSCCREVVCSVNKSQADEYSRLLGKEFLVMDDSSVGIKGPLLGLISVHLKFPEEDLMILACDLPKMSEEVLFALKDEKNSYPDFDCYCFEYPPGNAEPLCGIYTAQGIRKVLRMYELGKLEKFSMKFSLEHLNTRFMLLPKDWQSFFVNVNAHADLNGL